MAHMAASPPRARKHTQHMKMQFPLLWLKRVGLMLMVVVAIACLATAWTNIAASWTARGRTFDSIEATPSSDVGLVFGTSHRTNGRENLYFKHRVEAASDLWRVGKYEPSSFPATTARTIITSRKK